MFIFLQVNKFRSYLQIQIKMSKVTNGECYQSISYSVDIDWSKYHLGRSCCMIHAFGIKSHIGRKQGSAKESIVLKSIMVASVYWSQVRHSGFNCISVPCPSWFHVHFGLKCMLFRSAAPCCPHGHLVLIENFLVSSKALSLVHIRPNSVMILSGYWFQVSSRHSLLIFCTEVFVFDEWYKKLSEELLLGTPYKNLLRLRLRE